MSKLLWGILFTLIWLPGAIVFVITGFIQGEGQERFFKEGIIFLLVIMFFLITINYFSSNYSPALIGLLLVIAVIRHKKLKKQLNQVQEENYEE